MREGRTIGKRTEENRGIGKSEGGGRVTIMWLKLSGRRR